jgi:hypothetical protein
VRNRTLLVLALALVALVATGSKAYADVTAFAGLTTTPRARPAFGLAVGFNILMVGFEFEYSSTAEQQGTLTTGAPSLRTGMANFFVQTPFVVKRMRFYATVGAEIYREQLSTAQFQVTNVGINAGGGVKITLKGPLRFRLDYRIFQLNGKPLYSRSQRLYAGLNLAF